MDSITLNKLYFSSESPEILETASSVCGGRKFRRKFSKKDFPILGDVDETEEKEPIWLTKRSKDELQRKLSVSVLEVRSLYLDPDTGGWKWPINGADLVYPGIYLGDA